jgi:hypothetical protein
MPAAFVESAAASSDAVRVAIRAGWCERNTWRVSPSEGAARSPTLHPAGSEAKQAALLAVENNRASVNILALQPF